MESSLRFPALGNLALCSSSSFLPPEHHRPRTHVLLMPVPRLWRQGPSTPVVPPSYQQSCGTSHDGAFPCPSQLPGHCLAPSYLSWTGLHPLPFPRVEQSGLEVFPIKICVLGTRQACHSQIWNLGKRPLYCPSARYRTAHYPERCCLGIPLVVIPNLLPPRRFL